MPDYRVLIAAGGTGGHVFPAIAIADAIRENYPGSSIMFVGTKSHLEWKVVPLAGYEIKNIWISGFHRRITFKNLLFPVKLFVSLFQSLFIMQKFKPVAVVCCGGYVAGPVGWIAAKLGIRLFLQEQNSYPGITNRLLARYATAIYTAFEEAAAYFPPNRVHLTGNPVRNKLCETSREESLSHFGFEPGKKTLLVLGGSGGAKAVNDWAADVLLGYAGKKQLQVIWQCGKRYARAYAGRVRGEDSQSIQLHPFISEMKYAYGAADLVVARAGALTCSELMLTGKPSVLVPSPNVAGDHQTKNAREMELQGASVLVEEARIYPELSKTMETLLSNPEKLKNMADAALKMAKPDSAEKISTHIHSFNSSL